MSERTRRLKKLAAVQEQVKALHEMRHANHLASAAGAAREAEELAAASREPTLSATLFPELFAKRVERAHWRETMARRLAAGEAAKVATETVRGQVVEERYQAARREDERQREDLERLERLARPQ